MKNIYLNRVIKLNKKEILKNNEYIVYWMQASQRYDYNHALAYSIEMANRLDKELIVYFSITDNFPEANERHYYFMLEGLVELKKKLSDNNIYLLIEKNNIIDGVNEISKGAVSVITDRGYLKIQKKWRNQISKKINCSFIEVESDVIVPVDVASQKEEYAAYTFRRKINVFKSEYINEFNMPKLDSEKFILNTSKEINLNNRNEIGKVIEKLNIDHSIKKSKEYLGGYAEANKLLKDFIENKIDHYSEDSNDPTKNINSHLSPYLHFGQISPMEIVNEVLKIESIGKEDFLEQLIVRRELAFNFINQNNNYNKKIKDFLPNWAIKTMDEHKNDKREYNYTLKEFEAAKTHDEFWNAAQIELVKTGLMHNYMRMYWGKKVIEWTNNYQEAFDILVYLNNKYALDGRDPNSFTGIAWCFGKHDRAWKERKIFGKLRYMNSNGLKRKFDINLYVKNMNKL